MSSPKLNPKPNSFTPYCVKRLWIGLKYVEAVNQLLYIKILNLKLYVQYFAIVMSFIDYVVLLTTEPYQLKDWICGYWLDSWQGSIFEYQGFEYPG